MNNFYRYFSVLVISICSCLDVYCFELTHRENFARDKIQISDVELEGETFSVIEYENFFKTNNVGEAKLPFKILEFEVPSNMYSFSISCEFSGKQLISHNGRIEISQEDVVSNSVDKVTAKSYKTYSSDIFPLERVEILEDGYRMGNIHILHVAVFPFIYNAQLDELSFVESIDLKITDASASIYAKSKVADNNVFESKLRPLKMSNSVLSSASISEVYRPRVYVGDSLPVYEYAVITSQELAPEFDKLIGFKKQKGLDAGVVCIEDILRDDAFLQGDTISGINDDAGKLRAYLMACRQSRNGDMFVLLGGNPNVVPIRNALDNCNMYVTVKSQESHPRGGHIPTDLYFSDMNGIWYDVENEEFSVPLLSEWNKHTKIDFNPEIYVGRISCKNKKEIYNYVSKLLKYEMSPGDGDYTYLRNFMSTQNSDMLNKKQANIFGEKAIGLYDSHTIFDGSYDGSKSDLTGNLLINSINANHYGLMNFHNHAGSTAIALRYAGNNLSYSLVSRQGVSDLFTYAPYEDAHGLDMLKNGNYPSIAYTLSCDPMPFDNIVAHWDDCHNEKGLLYLPDGIYNLGDSFTIGGLYGGPAFIGNTRYGYVESSFSQELVFFDLLKNDGTLPNFRG